MEQEYEDSEGAEDFEDYGPEGYHPAFIGEKIFYKYTIVQKLGWGHFSTVWLVEVASNPPQYMALKIQRSKPSHAEAAEDEMQLLKTLRDHQSDPQWLELLGKGFGIEALQPIIPSLPTIYKPLTLIDQFAHFGMHGKHQCSVFELMGPNLLDLIQHYEYKQLRMPLKIAKKVTRDVLIGLVYMHEVCHMIHTDLKPENVMISLTQEEQTRFVEGLKSYKKKPLSMKYLYKLKAKNPEKNRKKYDKKKLKKKAAKEAQKPGEAEAEEIDATESSEQPAASVATQQIVQQDKFQVPEAAQQQQALAAQTTKVAEPNKKPKKKKKKKTDNPKKNQQEVSQDEPETKPGAVPPASIPKAKDTKKQPQSKENQQSESQGDSSDQERSEKRVYTQQEIDNLNWKNIKIDLTEEFHCKIVDFGNGCMEDHHFCEEIQTREYRAPEVILGHHYLPNTDVWSLACVVYEMLTNSYLFKPKDKYVSKDEDHLYKMIELLGPMPKQFATQGQHSKKFFTKKGELTHGNPNKKLPISVLLHEDYDYSVEQAQKIQAFLRPMLEYEPSKRISALEALRSPWLWE